MRDKIKKQQQVQKQNDINLRGGKVVTGFTFLYSEGSECIIQKDRSEQVQSVLITFICEVPEVKNETKHPIMFPSAAHHRLTTSEIIYFTWTRCLNLNMFFPPHMNFTLILSLLLMTRQS